MRATMRLLLATVRGPLATLLWLGAMPPAHASPWSWFSPELRREEEAQRVIVQHLHDAPELPSPQPHESAGFHSGFAPDADAARWVQVDLGEERDLDAVVIVPAVLGSAEAYGFPLRFRVEASNDPLFAEPVTLLDHAASEDRPTLGPWHIPAHGVRARHVRFTATRLTPQPRKSGRFIFCLGELMAFSGGRNVALRAPVTAPKAVETAPTWAPSNLVDGFSALGPPVIPESNPGNGWHSGIETTPDTAKWVQVDLGTNKPIQEIRLIPAHPSDYPDRFGFGFPRRFRVEVSEAEDFRTPHLVFDATTSDFPNPGDNPVAFPVPDSTTRYVRVTATRLWERSHDFVFAVAELQVLANGQNAALGAVVTASDDTVTPSWSRERLVDGKSSAGTLVDESEWLRRLSARRELMDSLAASRERIAPLGVVAQKRAAWLGLGLAGGAGLVVLLGMRRSRQARLREVEALRQRISRDLHDEIGSHLGSIRLMSELALRDPDRTQAHETLQEIHRLSREAAESMRSIVWLVREGEAPTMERLAEALRESSESLLKKVETTFASGGDKPLRHLSLEAHRQIFLFFREAAHNIARHAQAKKVDIRFCWNENTFELHLVDDGLGFDPSIAVSGSGLANLRHRGAALGGEAEITSSPGRGTHIKLVAPIT